MKNVQLIIEVFGAILVIASAYMILKNRILEARHRIPASKKISAKYFRKYKVFANIARIALFFSLIGTLGLCLLIVSQEMGLNYGDNPIARAAFWAIRLAGISEMWFGLWVLVSSLGHLKEDFFSSVKDAMGSWVNQIVITTFECMILVAPITYIAVVLAYLLRWLTLFSTGAGTTGPLLF